MSAGVRLTDAQARALRILADADHTWVRESNRTDETVPCVHWQSGHSLDGVYLADYRWDNRRGVGEFRIRSKGRQALREHDAKAGGSS